MPDGIPAIVTKDLFDRVQEKLAKNKKAPARHKSEDDYLLTPKLYCGKCKSFMVGESGTSKTSAKYRYYNCASVKNHKGCDKKTVRKDWIEDLVIKQIQKVLFDDALIENLIAAAKRQCKDILRTDDDTDLEQAENGKIAVMFTAAYLYEHREEADHHALNLTLRALLFGSRKEGF